MLLLAPLVACVTAYLLPQYRTSLSVQGSMAARSTAPIASVESDDLAFYVLMNEFVLTPAVVNLELWYPVFRNRPHSDTVTIWRWLIKNFDLNLYQCLILTKTPNWRIINFFFI